MKDRPDLHITLQLTEGFLDRQQVLVIAKYLLFATLDGLKTCVQQVKAVEALLDLDELVVFLII